MSYEFYNIIPSGFDTSVFCQEALRFKSKGFYCEYPRGTLGYKKYWDRQIVMCLEGLTVGGVSITGFHYFYLNFCPIKRSVEVEVVKNGKTIKKNKRILSFPDFYDYDKVYFDSLDAAADLGKHMVVLKARRKGYSYKGASMLCRNFFLLKNSTNFVVAADLAFLTTDGILTKAWAMMSFIDKNTAWRKKKQVNNTKLHKRASYIDVVDGIGVERGYMSEIIGKTIKDDPDKLRGISGDLILFEESGKNPHLVAAWGVVESSLSQGKDTYGLMIAFGTGGTSGSDYAGLRELFYNPKPYGIYELNNVWDLATSTTCGFFVPDFVHLEGFIDDDGRSQCQAAYDWRLGERKNLESGGDSSAIDRYISEHPFNPAEATLTLTGNIFPRKQLMEHLAYIELHAAEKNAGMSGSLRWDHTGKVEFYLDGSRPINDFPSPKNCGHGSIVIYEHPYRASDGSIPNFLYIAGTDPYDHDQAMNGSLGSTFIYKRYFSPGMAYNMIVAEYTGRPETADEYYENVRMLLMYYNATDMFENNIIGILGYFKNKKSLSFLADSPNMKDVLKDGKTNRGKGVNMSKEVIRDGEKKIKKELLEYDGTLYGYQKIKSVPLIKELIAYNDLGNFDRVRALMCVLIYKDELFTFEVKEPAQKIAFFPKNVFVAPVNSWAI